MTDESINCHRQLNLHLVDDVADAKRIMNLHAADTSRENGHVVVVALPWPRRGLTADAAIARRWDFRRQTAFHELTSLAALLTRTAGCTYIVAELPYRWSRHPARREKRITAALDRLGVNMSFWKLSPDSSPGLDEKFVRT